MCGKRFYPSAAIALYLFNYVRDDYVTWEEEQYMHMVINTNNPYDLAASSVYKLADIAMYTLNVLLSDGWTCCLNVEYQMYVYFAQWLCHVLMLLPFQGVITFRHVNPGCRFRLCPEMSSYLPSSFCLTVAGVITPRSLILSMSCAISSSSRTLKGWSGKSISLKLKSFLHIFRFTILISP